MPANLKIDNLDDLNIYQVDRISVDTEIGSLNLAVDNTSRYIPGMFGIIGKVGNDSSELVQINGVLSAQLIRLEGETLLFHHRNDYFTLLYGDSIRIYRAAAPSTSAPADSDYSMIGQIAIDYDETQTTWSDPDGSNQFWYKFTYFNSFNNRETALENSVGAIGGGGNHYATVEMIRHEAGFDGNPNVTDETIDRKRAAAEARINGMLAGKYPLPFPQPTSPQIVDLTVRLAAGLVMIAEYGIFDGQDKSKGEKKRDDALAELKDLQTGVSVITDMEAISTVPEENGGFDSSFGESSQRESMFTTKDRY